MEKLINYQNSIASTPLIDRPVGEKRQDAIASTLLIDRPVGEKSKVRSCHPNKVDIDHPTSFKTLKGDS